MSEEQKEQQQNEMPLHQKIQADYMKACTQLGDLSFKVDHLKHVMHELQKQYAEALAKHQAENPPKQ